jgi:hypothetical protein
MIADARRFADMHMAPDPHQRSYARMWLERLSQPSDEIGAAQIEDSARGRLQ